MLELSPACHSVCHTETKIQDVRLCGLNPPLQCQNKFTETWLTIAVSLTRHLPLFLAFFPLVLSVLCQSWSSSLSAGRLSLSLSFSSVCLWTSNPAWLLLKCIPTLFIVPSFKTSTCFSSLHHFVAVGPFPLYVLLVWMGILGPFHTCSLSGIFPIWGHVKGSRDQY